MSLEYFIDQKYSKIASGYYGNIALLSNQCSYSFRRSRYLFEILQETNFLHVLFVPEHGLFGENQDQIALENSQRYNKNTISVVSLYTDNESDLKPKMEHFTDVDTLIIDIQDVGSRYYTFAISMEYTLVAFDEYSKKECVSKKTKRCLIIERPNYSGRYVEGTLLDKRYQSFVGRFGIPHRHGLTIGEMAKFFYQRHNCVVQLEVIHDPQINYFCNDLYATPKQTQQTINNFQFIPPSPNMSNRITPLVYSGQCLWEGTNISEGRGTTRPFEIFGAPFLKKICAQLQSKENSKYPIPHQKFADLRPLCFIPTFHKFKNQICYGWQIHVKHPQYSSLSHSLRLMHWIKSYCPEFSYREQPYEFESEKKAIEILVGDQEMLAYIEGKTSFKYIQKKMSEHENLWIKQTQDILLHPQPLIALT